VSKRADKANHLLTESRVRILAADEEFCNADVQGDSDTYRVNVYRDEQGRTIRECTCPYSTQFHPIKADCSHVRAVQKVWKPEPK
jgi:uncharacterized Zn finger protein